MPRQYHDKEWILVVCAVVEGAWPMQVLGSISRAAGLHPPQPVRRNRCVRTYHGKTGKMAVAHDEWLEFNNKEFDMYPSVGTLDGMMHQGQFIGPTQKAKRVIVMIYLPGAILDCIVCHSGMGSKGNCTPEEELIGEVIGLFLESI